MYNDNNNIEMLNDNIVLHETHSDNNNEEGNEREKRIKNRKKNEEIEEKKTMVSSVIQSWAQCPICFEIMILPTILSCGHTFCRVCYLQLIFGRTVFQPIRVCITCAICQHQTTDTLPADNIHRGQINYSLRDAICETYADEYKARHCAHEAMIEADSTILKILYNSRVRFYYKRGGSSSTLVRMVNLIQRIYRHASSMDGFTTLEDTDLMYVAQNVAGTFRAILGFPGYEPSNIEWMVLIADGMFIYITRSSIQQNQQ